MGKITNSDVKTKSRASMIIDGEIEPEPNERYLLNLRKRVPFNEMPPEKRQEIARKGQKALRDIYGKKKSAKEALTDILSLRITDDIVKSADIDNALVERVRQANPDATFYDLIQAVAVGRALDGSINAMTYVRDTNGDKPVEQAKIDVNGIMTEQDRALLSSISDRLQHADAVQIVEEITRDNVETPTE